MKLFITLLFLLITTTSFAIETTAIRDRAGRVTGTRTTNGKYSTYRSRSGVVTKTRTTEGKYDFYKSRSGVSKGSRTRVK